MLICNLRFIDRMRAEDDAMISLRSIKAGRNVYPEQKEREVRYITPEDSRKAQG